MRVEDVIRCLCRVDDWVEGGICCYGCWGGGRTEEERKRSLLFISSLLNHSLYSDHIDGGCSGR